MRHIDIVLVDGFPVLSLTLITEPLRLANRESLKQEFAWRFISVEGGALKSSSGFLVPTEPLDDRPADAVILLASYHPEQALRPGLLRWLRRRARRGDLMGCVDTGALLFAEAGLLSARPAAVHYEAVAGFAESYPQQMFIDRLYDFSPPRFSSSGGVATFDMTLALIRHCCDKRTAERVAQVLNYVPTGHGGEQERLLRDRSIGMIDADLGRAADIMLGTLRSPLSIAQVAQRTGLPQWRLSRLFRRHLRSTPSRYYLELRLTHARHLLRNSQHRIGHIASLCGFENHETFTRAYVRRFGLAPTRDRD